MNQSATHYSQLVRKVKGRTAEPTDPYTGQEFYNTDDDEYQQYSGSAWIGFSFTTTTTTSTSTTTTSTSTTTTSTSTTTTSTSTSTTTTSTSTTTTSTSTTTTL